MQMFKGKVGMRQERSMYLDADISHPIKPSQKSRITGPTCQKRAEGCYLTFIAGNIIHRQQ
eukprot:10940095-Ditylum_brightwellii.AAC.1